MSFFDVDYFSFVAHRGVLYTFVLEFVTVEDANILVVNSTDRGSGSSPNQVFSNGGNHRRIDWISRTTDTYFIEVTGSRNGSDGSAYLGSYLLSATADMDLEDRHNDGQAGASLISIDNVYQGAISPWTNQPGLAGTKDGGDDQDYFSFPAMRGVKYTVDIQLGTVEGVEISIVGPDGRLETSNSGVGSTLEWISPTSATYYVAVAGSSRFKDSIGTYSLTLSADAAYQDRHSHSQVGATIVTFGNAHQGAISPESDRDVFFFQASRGIKYSINADLGTAQGIDLAVEEPGGKRIASNGGINTTLEWVAPSTKSYFIVVSGSLQVRDPVGTYSLLVDADASLEDRHEESLGAATLIRFGNELKGAISPSDDRDYFSFTAARGVMYSIDVALETARGVDITILTPDGAFEISNGGIGSSVNWTAEAFGEYVIVISSPSQITDPVGTYALKVEGRNELEDRHGDEPAVATRVDLGSTYQASISPVGDADYFAFRATRGVRYSFQLGYGTAGAVSLAVNKLNGEPAAARNYGDGTDVVWIAPDDDEYVVAVTGSPRIPDPVGTYSLQIAADMALEDRHSDSPAEATQVVLGNATAGAVSPADDADYFFFDALQGEEYLVQVDLGTVPAVRLSVSQDLAGFTASNFGVGNTLAWRAPITGRYLVAVTAEQQSRDPVGTYQMTVTTQDEPSATTPEPTPPSPEPTPMSAPTPSPAPLLPGPALIVGSRTAPPGSEVLVPVSLREAEGLSSLGFTLNYDPSVVEVVSVSKGARLSPATFSYNQDVAGAVRVGFAATTGLSGGGSAVIVEFRTIGEEDTASLITLTDVLASNSSGAQLPLQLGEGLITIGQPMAGDGNGDGQITALDALIALKISLQLSQELSRENLVMDLDGDGSVTVEDVRQILVMAGPE